jgi:CubicO group peptidase (beta-lactamase class C family)
LLFSARFDENRRVSLDGTLDPVFKPVAEVLRRHLQRAGGGAAVCVYHRGRKAVDIWGGRRDETGRPWTEDTMAMSFSTTKGVVSTLLHVLADRALLDYDDPVAKHWPEFARAGKGRITVRDVLTHRAGLPGIRPLIDRAERMLDWTYMVEALAAARPMLTPGSASAYHALTYGWLAGEIVQRVAEKPLPQVIREELAEPLGLDGLYVGAPESARRRAAHLASPAQGLRRLEPLVASRPLMATLSFASRAALLPVDPLLMREALMPPGNAEVLFEPRVLDTPIPAANGLFTARSLARLYAALAAGGTLDGVRLLSRGGVRLATEVQTRERDRVLVLRPHWRLGYHSAFTTRGRVETAFGHFGYGGSGAWADPTRQLAVAMVNNNLGGGLIGDYRIAEIGTAAMLAARQAEAAVPSPVPVRAVLRQ